MILTTPLDGRSSAGCHRGRVVLDSCELSTRKCGLSADHGSASRYLWPPTHVLWIGGFLHNWEHYLRYCSHGTRYACRSNDPGCRRWRHTEREPDYTVGSCTASTAVDISRLHTASFLVWNISCSHHWGPLDQDTMAMVSSSVIATRQHFRF
jgi:hypothetical protein